MSLEIGSALGGGVEKLTTAAGAQLAALYAFFVLLSSLGASTAIATLGPAAGDRPGVVLPLPTGAGILLYLFGIVGALLLAVVIFRTLSQDATELDTLPAGVTERLAVTAVFLFVANLVVGVAVVVGLLLLVVPGIFLAVSLAFTPVYVAVEGEGPFEAMGSSWALATGHRFPLFGLGLAVVVISFLVGALGSVVSVLSPAVGAVVQALLSGISFVFANGVLVDAFQQLEEAEPESVGPLTAEDLE